MNDARGQRWLGVGGLVFVGLVLVSVFTAPTKGTSATAASVATYMSAHKSGLRVGAIFIGLAIIEGLFFFWYLRAYLCEVIANRHLATVAYAGVIIFAVSGGIQAGLRMTMADGVGRLDAGGLQTLNMLGNDLNFALGGAGVAVFLLGVGIAIIRHGPLPTWLGWLAAVLGVIGAVVGAPAIGVWLIVASIVMLARAGNAAPPISVSGAPTASTT
jgi:hypothetical protein